MNKERLEKLAAHIQATPPGHLDMRRWCGTACCIGGHTEQLFDLPKGGATDFLGLTWAQEDRLFWPEEYIQDASQQPLPAQAAAVIRHLAETGRVEWEKFV